MLSVILEILFQNQKCYWNIEGSSEQSQSYDFYNPELTIESLENLLTDSIKRRMEADVPLGAFLSGGIDSTAVVALMQHISKEPVKTFSIGFKEEDYDEARQAKNIANYLGTEHSELYVSPEDTLSLLPKLTDIYDEPFADNSQIPTFIVSNLAKKHVTVSLSGDGGDELFYGYSRYFQAYSWWSKLSLVPRFFRQLISLILTTIPGALARLLEILLKNIN